MYLVMILVWTFIVPQMLLKPPGLATVAMRVIMGHKFAAICVKVSVLQMVLCTPFSQSDLDWFHTYAGIHQ